MTSTNNSPRRRRGAPVAGAFARPLCLCLCLCLTLCLAPPAGAAKAEELKIPNLGEASTSLFSKEYEYNLGRAWLRIFRSQVATVDDPLLYTYLEDLIFTLVTHSELQDRRVELVVVDNPRSTPSPSPAA
jgi:predicted Zn-dependent protease